MILTQEKIVASIGVAWSIATLLLVSESSFSADSIAVSADSRYEYNSNVFDLQGGSPVPGTTDYQHWDELFTYGASLDANYLWNQQTLFAKLSVNEFRYDHFTLLNHREYLLDGGLNWKLGGELDGTLEVSRNVSMVPFSNVEFAALIIQTEQRESAKFGWDFIPDWRIEGTGRYRTVDQASTNIPDIDLTESYGEAALKYIGLAGVTAGLSGAYSIGNYTGATAATNFSYKQTNVALVATYAVTGRSDFSGGLGYSERTSSSASNSLSGFTGDLNYSYQLTGKTSMQLAIGRAINSYVANTGSEIDTNAALTVRWQVSYLLGINASYTWLSRDLPGQGDAPFGSERVDHDQLASIKMDYEPLQWLSIMPYITVETRSSNYIGNSVVGANFNSTVYGVSFIVKWQDHAKSP